MKEKKKRTLSPEQKERAKIRHRKWSSENREHINTEHRKWRKRATKNGTSWYGKASENQAFYLAAKANPCTDCGNKFPSECMDFDHKPGEVKYNNVGTLVAHHYSKEAIVAEIAKCELVCSNCHRTRTAKRRTGVPRTKLDGIDSNGRAGIVS